MTALDALVAFEELVGEPEAGDHDQPATAAPHTSRILVAAERLAIFVAASLSGCAMLAARIGGLPVHPLALALWSVGACVVAVCLAAVVTDPTSTSRRPGRRTAAVAVLIVALLGCLTGTVAAADGVAGPAWVL